MTVHLEFNTLRSNNGYMYEKYKGVTTIYIDIGDIYVEDCLREGSYLFSYRAVSQHLKARDDSLTNIIIIRYVTALYACK